MSEIKNEWDENKVEFTGFLLQRPRQELYDRINLRVEQMVKEGLIDEIISLPKNISAVFFPVFYVNGQIQGLKENFFY